MLKDIIVIYLYRKNENYFDFNKLEMLFFTS